MPKRGQSKRFSNGESTSSDSESSPKNSPKRPTYSLQDAILIATEQVGDPDRSGRGGLIGYLKYLAVKDPRTFGMLLATHLRQSQASYGQKSRIQTPGLNDRITLETAGEELLRRIFALKKNLAATAWCEDRASRKPKLEEMRATPVTSGPPNPQIPSECEASENRE